MPNRNKSEPHAVTARLSNPLLQHIVATAEKLGLSRHKTLPLCLDVGLAIMAARAGVPVPATSSLKR